VNLVGAQSARAQPEEIDEEVGIELDENVWLRVYDSDGTVVYPFEEAKGCFQIEDDYCLLVPSASTNPDWSVEFYADGPADPCGTCDWSFWWHEDDVPTADFVTFEFAEESDEETVIRRYVYVSTIQRYGTPGTVFYYPDESPGGSPDVSFRVFENLTIKATRSSVRRPTDDYFEDVFTAGTYVMPYCGRTCGLVVRYWRAE
jgi:hypothetical protein